MNTKNWRIRIGHDGFFFVEGDLPEIKEPDHYPRVEVMQEDYGDHNGYTEAMRYADAELIILAPKMKYAIDQILSSINSGFIPDVKSIKKILEESIIKNEN